MFRKFIWLGIFSIATNVNAASVSLNATYNNAWSGAVSGTPGPGQSNTFNATGGSPALAVFAGSPDLTNSTNTFNGPLTVQGSSPTTLDLSTSTNTFTSAVDVLPGGRLNAIDATNNFSGPVVFGGLSSEFSSYAAPTTNIFASVQLKNSVIVYFYNLSSGITSTFDSLALSNSSSMQFFNSRTTTVENTITTLTISDSANLSFTNSSTGNLINTIGTCSLSDGQINLGGTGNTNNIATMNWSGGAFNIVYRNGSFGSTSIQNLNITAPVSLALYDGGSLMTTPPSGTFTLFTVTNFTGDANNIQLTNTSPFFEVLSTTGPSGVTVAPDGAVKVTLISTAVTPNPSVSGLTSVLDDTLAFAMQNAQTQLIQNFAPTVSTNAKYKIHLRKALKQNPDDHFAAAVTALAESNTPMLYKFDNNSNVWVAPYMLRVRNSGLGGTSGFTEKNYGLLAGVNNYIKKINTNFTFVIGGGAANAQYSVKSSNSHAKTLILGLVAYKNALKDKLDLISSLYGIGSKNTQHRFGNPSPTQSYIANSNYKTRNISWQNEAGYEIKLQENLSLRPNIGLQLLANYRSAFSETDAGTFNQTYKSQWDYSGELYGGLGLRKRWDFNTRYEGKATLSYIIGRQSGNNNSTVMIYTATAPQGVAMNSTNPGLTVQYFNLYGSLFDKKTHLKVVPGLSYSTQKGQYSLWGTVKVEYDF